MVRVRTARAEGWAATGLDERHVASLRHARGQAVDESLRDWCEARAHPHGMLVDGECFCGLIRYDD
jgi:hypothetical protein